MAKPKKGAKKATKTTAKRTTGKARKAGAKKAAANASPPPARTLTPYLAVNDAAGAIEWYRKAFSAKEVSRQPAPGNKLMHAHLRIGDSDLFLSDIFPGADVQDPSRVGASVTLHLWTRNAEKLWKSAVENGAKVTMPYDDQFWGDTYGKLTDPYGHSWSFSWKSRLSKAELEQKRVEAMKAFGAQ